MIKQIPTNKTVLIVLFLAFTNLLITLLSNSEVVAFVPKFESILRVKVQAILP